VTEHKNKLTEEGQARRRFLKQAGTVAWASPFIVTMMSRAAQAQTTCGEQALDVDPPFALLCTNVTPCGTAQACVPDPTDPGPGNACICASP
jgi:hypothetical protein